MVSSGLRLGEAGVDAEAGNRWRLYIHPVAARLLRLLLRRPMRWLGYAG